MFDTRSASDAQRPIEFDTGMATVPDVSQPRNCDRDEGVGGGQDH